MSTAQDRPAGGVPCPRCTAPLVPGAAACPACDLPVTGPVAGELWVVDQEIAALRGRRAALLERLAAAPAAGARRSDADPYRVGSDAPPAAPAARRQLGAQQLLLAAGVLLVAVAAVVFAAVVWSAIGVLGQAAVLLAVCAAAAVASRLAARRGLSSSAEALAVLAVAVLVVDVAAARSLGLLGLDRTDRDVYALAGLLVVVGASAAADRLLRVPPRTTAPAQETAPDQDAAPAQVPAEAQDGARGGRPRTYAWTAVLGTAGVPALLTDAVDGGSLTWAAGALVLALACALAAPLVHRRGQLLGDVALVIGALHLGGAVLALLGVVLDRESSTRLLEAAAEFLLLCLGAAAVATRAREDRPRLARTARTASRVGAGGVLLSLMLLGGSTALVALAGVLAAAAASALLLRRGVPWTALVGAQGVALVALVIEPQVPAGTGGGPGWGRPLAWALLAASAGLTAQRRPVPSAAPHDPGSLPVAAWTALSALASLLAAESLPGEPTRALRTWLVLVVATALLALAGRAARRTALLTEVVLVAGWALGVAAALASADEGAAAGASRVTAVLAVAGASALATALLPGRAPWTVVGVVLLSTAWWSALDGTGISTPEVWTLPPALLALAVGVIAWEQSPSTPSWQTVGPGLVLALGPSAVLSASEPDLLRPVLTVLAAAAVCAVGVLRSWQAPLVVGAAAAAVVAVGQLGPYAVDAPLWASLGLAGTLLLVLAVRIEQARRDAARTLAWVRALH